MMEGKVSRRVAELPPSGIRAFFDLVAGSPDVVSLGVGEPDFVTPWHVRESGIYSLERGITSYTSNRGLPALLEAVAVYQKNLIGNDYHPKKEILVTVGVSQAVDLAMRSLVDPGDEVIYFEPCYVSYGPMIRLADGVPVAVSLTRDGFDLDIDAVKGAITGKTKAVLICSPNNPTGTVFSREALEKLAELCREHDLVVISDEIYAELVYEGGHVSLASLQGMKERTILLNGVSKAQSMTGWRIGYACGPEPLIEGMLKVHQYSMLCAPTTGQIAAAEALLKGRVTVERTRREYDRRRRFIVSAFREMGLDCHEPGGAFYAFPSIRKTGLKSVEFCRKLLEQERVAVVPGSAFGSPGEGYIRCAYAASLDDIKTATGRMSRFVERL